jgi:acyl carrier protein
MTWHTCETAEDQLDVVRQVIEELTGAPLAPDAAPDMPLTDLGVSSLMLFRFVTRLEEVSGLEIPDTDFDVRNFATLASTCSVLVRAAS